MTQKQVERRMIFVGIVANTISTVAGIFIYCLTGIQALFIDCFFSFIALLSSVTAFVISKASKRTTKHYPDGLHFLEPLYGIAKSLLTFGLFFSAVIFSGQVAWDYFTLGVGEPMNTGPVLPYTIALVFCCFGFSFYTKRQNRKISNTSTILTIESKTSFLDGLQSFAIGVAVLLLNMVDIRGPLGFLHYTGDFFVTVLLVITSLKEPVEEFITAFRELSGGTTSDPVLETAVCTAIQNHCSDILPVERYKIVKTGRADLYGLHFHCREYCR